MPEDLRCLPPDHSDRSRAVDQVIIVHKVLEVLVALYVAFELHGLVE
jgi:hypothetical protein